MCFGRSKEPSHRDGSFEYPKYMLWPRNEKTRDNLSSKFPRRVCSATVTSENLNIFKTSPFLELSFSDIINGAKKSLLDETVLLSTKIKVNLENTIYLSISLSLSLSLSLSILLQLLILSQKVKKVVWDGLKVVWGVSTDSTGCIISQQKQLIFLLNNNNNNNNNNNK